MSRRNFPRKCLCFPGLREKDTNSFLLRSCDGNKGSKQQQLLLVLPTVPGRHFPTRQERLSVGAATGAGAHRGKEAEINSLGMPIAFLPGKTKKAMGFLAECACVNSKSTLMCLQKSSLSASTGTSVTQMIHSGRTKKAQVVF